MATMPAPGMVMCPIWGAPARPLLGYGGRDGQAVDSPRAGGRYFISRHAEIELRNSDIDLKIKLTHEIFDHNALASTPEIHRTTVSSLATVALARPSVRALRLLQYLVRESKYLGQTFSGYRELDVWSSGDVLGIGSKLSSSAWPLLSATDSVQEEELVFLLRMLQSQDAVHLSGGDGIPDIVVTPNGYEIADAQGHNIQGDQAFIAMWFDDAMSEPYEHGIEPAVRALGYKPLRIDKKEHINKIDDEIVAEIRRSRFLIADFTSDLGSPRGGVYFEAGYALALGMPVIWSCRADRIQEVHFDTRQFNHIVWNHANDLKNKLQNRIGAVLGDGPHRQAA
jgi:nucleoside 2-deoxyribosyltransferase